jgi:type I restriction enzyme S subunit
MKWQPYPGYKPSGVEWLGEIPEHWDVLRLKNIAGFGYGDSLPAEVRIPGHYDVYGSNGIVGQHELPNTQPPCLIIGRKGSFGKVAYSEKPCFAIDTTYFIDCTLTKPVKKYLHISGSNFRVRVIRGNFEYPAGSCYCCFSERPRF